MGILNIKDIESLLMTAKKCTGDVFLVTNDGNKLNLKSDFIKYVSIDKIFDDKFIDKMNLEVSNIEDIQKFLDLMIIESRKSKNVDK